MDSLTFNEHLILFHLFITWILVYFLLTSRNKNYLSNVLLALFLLANAQDSSGLISRYLLYPKFPGLGMLLNSTVFLIYPLFYLYTLSVIYKGFKIRKKHLIHLSFFVLNFIFFTPSFYLEDFQSKIDFVSYDLESVPLEITLSYILIHIQIPFYLILSYFEVRKYKTILFENYSNASLSYYKWLLQLLMLFGINFILGAFKNIVMFNGADEIYTYVNFILVLSTLGLVCWLVIKALRNPELFSGIDMSIKKVRNILSEGTQERLYSKEIVKLMAYMEENKPYLDPSLNIYDLSKGLEMSSKELSILINHKLNKHFFDFINEYRIEHAMQILTDPEKREFTVLEILYEVGFNSKSSFNTAFKKHTNQTPTQYRKTHLKSGS